jgi:hypothetical protein
MFDPNKIRGDSILELHSYQKLHYEKIKSSLLNDWGVVDTSPLGTGKTIIAIHTMIDLEFDFLVVIAPPTLHADWIKTTKKYGVSIKYLLSYRKLAGTKKNGCGNELLDRSGDSYTPTITLLDLLENKVLVVFDEIQFMKNGSTANMKSGHALVSSIVNMRSNSRVMLLSGLPIDKEQHSASLLKLLGLTTKTDLYDYDNSKRIYTPTGLKDIEKYCSEIDKIETDKIISRIPLNKDTTGKICYTLLERVIVKRLFHQMIPPIKKIIPDVKNGFYKMDEESIKKIKEGLCLLREVCPMYGKGCITMRKDSAMGKLVDGFVLLESGKINTLVKLTRECLNENKNAKVIIFIWYTDTIGHHLTLREKLIEYDPVIITGRTKMPDRDKYISRFQEPNCESRLLICSAKVGGTGLSFDDRDGNYPRTVFVIPSYNFIECYQCSGRVFRLPTTKSTPTVRYVYSSDGGDEVTILSNLANKSETAKGVLKDKNMKLPGEYEKYYDE